MSWKLVDYKERGLTNKALLKSTVPFYHKISSLNYVASLILIVSFISAFV